MKWLLWLLLLAGGIWLLRGMRVRAEAPPRSGDARPQAPAAGAGAGALPPGAQGGLREIVPCALCGLHLPRDEAITGPDGHTPYCSEAHRIEHKARQRGGQPAQ